VRRLVIGLAVFGLIVVTGARASLSMQRGEGGTTTTRTDVTRADYDRWRTELTNWGRWGKDDQMGALNLITPAKRKQAASLVKEGVTVSLSLDANFNRPANTSNPNAVAPFERIMTSTGPGGSGDRLSINFHGFVVTHLDAFGHRFFDGKMYNGFSYEDVTKEDGAKRGSIYSVRGGILTRGVLMDIPRLKGVPYLEPGTRIYPEDLEAWEKKAGVKVMPGDALFIRTGRWTWMKTTTPVPSALPQEVSGLDASVIPWLKKRDVALLGSEQAQDAAPYRKELPALPVHDFALIVLGVHLFDNTNLDDLAEAAAARRRWEFMLMAAPLRVPGGTGSPLNPIAVF
jgi:kynurenine formamidase